MCHTKWIFILAFTILGVTSINITKSSSPCEVKVELLDRMINVVNKDELCLCLKYKKATSPHKTSEPCNLNIVNSGGNLIISADSVCECAGYETNSTLKYTTGSDIPHITITKALTADDMRSVGVRTETVIHLPTNTTTDDKVKENILLSNSNVTEVLDLAPTTNVTIETKKAITDYSKRLTTDYTITTNIPFVYYLKNSSTAIESGTTEDIGESKPTTQEPKKSTKTHFSYFGKVATTDWTTDITTPTVVFTGGTKTIDDFYASNGTTTTKISLIDIVRNFTTTSDTTERTTVTKDKPLDVKHFHTSHLSDFTDLGENTSTPNMTLTTDKLVLVLSNVTSSKANYSATESYSSTIGKLSSIFIETDHLETILTSPLETIASITVTDFGYKRVIPISTTTRNNYTTTFEPSRTTTPNVTHKSTVFATTKVVYHSNYTGTDGYTKVKSTKVDASEGVITEDTSTTTKPITLQSTTDTNSSYTDYETNSTLKYTTGLDIPHDRITKALRADDMRSESDRTEPVTHLPTNTTTDDKVKDKILLSNSSITEVLDLAPTTNGTTETKKAITDDSKRLTTDHMITTKIPFVYAFKNSSIAIESGTTEEIEETKQTTQEPKKSKIMHISYFGKVVTTDLTTDITTRTVVFTGGTKTIDDFYATNGTTTSKISLIDIVRNSTTSKDTTQCTTVSKDKPLDVKHSHTSHITNFTDLVENTSTPNMTRTTDKLGLVFSNVTSSKANYSTTESYSSTIGKLSSIFIEADTTETLDTTNKKDILETILTIPIETIASTTVTDFGYKRVIPISTTSRNNYMSKFEPSKTTTPNVTHKSTVSASTEVVYHSNYTGTDGYTKVKSTKVDAESAGVITEGISTTTTPITLQSTTSSYTESDTIKGDVISYTNITLITILTIICVVLIILLIVKIINSCLRKGSYVLPHESDGNIEMECKN